MSELIEIQAVLDIVDGYSESQSNVEDVTQDIISDIVALPSVNPQEQKWIPVSEKLPEDSGEYLVSVVDGLYGNGDYQAVGVVWFAHQKDYAIAKSEWRELGEDEEVIAWMPKPKHYKESEEQA